MLGQSSAKEVLAPALPTVPAPIPFAKIIGQGKAVAVLEDAVASGRVHHAWVLEGPVGVGKRTAALAFASLLLDPTTETGLSGGVVCDEDSPVQRLLRAGTHPDLALINKELARFHDDSDVRKRKQTSISVDVVRQFLLSQGALSPGAPTSMRSRAGRVFIIDEAELMNVQAQNAILKYLEEPPPRVVLMLVCNAPQLLLPTIRSRCQRVAFGSLSRGQLDHWLADAQERGAVPAFENEAREFLLSFADGSPGMLTRAIEGNVAGWWEKLKPLLSIAASGKHAVELGAAMAGLVDDWAKAHVEQNELASKEAANHTAASWLFRLLAWHATTRLKSQIAESGQKQAMLEGVEPIALREIDAIQAAQQELDANVGLALVMEKLSAELVAS
jgi:DNA polymerase-3 subunit delta'